MLRDANHRQSAEFLDREKCMAYIVERRSAAHDAEAATRVGDAANSSQRMTDGEMTTNTSLEGLDDSEILRIYRSLKNEESVLRNKSNAAREPFLFFNQPSADADFAYWLDLEVWTIDQAAALSLGKEPSVVNAESMRGPLRSSKTRLAYRNRSDAIASAVQAGTLQADMRPKIFVEWAIHRNWPVPEQLCDWVKLPTYAQLTQQAKRLEAEVAHLIAARQAAMLQPVDELDVRIQRTYYKMILTMAIARYDHQVKGNSHGPKQIEDDSLQLGDERLNLKAKTVHGALQSAAEYLGIKNSIGNNPKWKRIVRES